MSTRSVSPTKIQNCAMSLANRGKDIQVHYYMNRATGKIVELKSVFAGVE